MNVAHTVLRMRSAVRRAYVFGRQSYKAAARSLGRETIEAYWWNAQNFGDAITPTLLEKLSGLSAIWSKDSGRPVLLSIGSVISHAKPGWMVWGAGCISPESPVPEGLKVLAVRGPLTHARLTAAGYDVPRVFGDPALMLPIIAPPAKEPPSYDWGVIPHYVDFDHPSVVTLMRERSANRRVLVIDPRASTSSYLRDLRRCRAIATSSLHGLVVGEAYRKPTVWLDYAGAGEASKIVGGSYKFSDFWQSVGKPDERPLHVGEQLDWKAMEARIAGWRPMQWDPKPLMQAFPFVTPSWLEHTAAAEKYFGGFSASVPP